MIAGRIGDVVVLDADAAALVGVALSRLEAHVRRDGRTLPAELARLVIVCVPAADRERHALAALPRLVDAGRDVEPLALTYAEAAKAIGCSSRTVQRIVEAGDLRAVRVAGTLPRIPTTELVRYLEEALT